MPTTPTTADKVLIASGAAPPRHGCAVLPHPRPARWRSLGRMRLPIDNILSMDSGKRLGALAKHPGATAAELAEDSGIGRSTANKALAVLESQRRVTRKPGARDAGRRLPDRWSVAGAPARARPRPAKAQAPEASVPTLGKGQLRAMVLDHLRSHTGEELTPSAVAAALGRSAGAVANALVKLTVEGSVVRAGDAPRRFSYGG